MSAPHLSVIIVTYNSMSVVGNCLDALISDESGASAEIIVVDNCSVDGTAEFVESRYPSVRLIRAESNDGFAKGVALGVSAARGQVYCLLNPDARAAMSTLQAIAKSFEPASATGIVAPLISQPSGRLRVVSAGHLPTTWRMFTHFSGLSALGRWVAALEGHYLLSSQLRGPREVGWVTGACLLISRVCWDAVGGISTRWFMYAEDIELCGRVRAAGFRVMIDDRYVVEHMLGASAVGHEARISSEWIVNLYDYFCQDLSSGLVDRWLWRQVVLAGLRSRAIAYSLRAAAGGQGGTVWAREAARFRVYAKDLSVAGAAMRSTNA